MGAREYNYDEDQSRDYSDLSDRNQENLRSNKLDGVNYDPNSLASLENSSAQSSRASDVDIASNETAPWRNEVKGSEAGGTHRTRYRLNRKNPSAKPAKLKGKMPRAAKYVGILTAGGSVAVVGLFSTFITGLMPIHVMELISDETNTSASTMDVRSGKILKHKFDFDGGKCSKNILSVKCKFGTISDKQIKKLQQKGIEPVLADGEGWFGRKKVIGLDMNIDGEKIELRSNNLTSQIKTNPKIRTALQKGFYSGRFASFLDGPFNNLASKLGWKKSSPSDADLNEQELIEEITDEANDTKTKFSLNGDGDENQEGETPEATASNREKVKNNNKFVRKIQESAESLKNSKGYRSITNFSKGLMDSFGSAFSSFNFLDEGCEYANYAFGMVSGVKRTRIEAMMQFALTFLSLASMIKAGDGSTSIAAVLGNGLTGIQQNSGSENTTANDPASILANAANSAPEKLEPATASQGYRALAYNDRIAKLDDSSMQFAAGAIGVLASIYNPIRRTFNSTGGDKVCGFLNSGLGQVTGIAVGVIAFIGTGGTSALGQIATSIGKEIGKSAVIQTAISVLTPIIAGKVISSFISGQDYGNALISGSTALMGRNTVYGGGGVLSKKEAVAFHKFNEEKIAERAEEIRAIKSPFDPTSRHTFLGSIASISIPYSSQLKTIGGIFTSMLSITSRAFSSVIPTADASDAANFTANMEVCEDADIVDKNIGTDIFCNPYTGISSSVIEKSHDEIFEALVQNGDIDPEKEVGQELLSQEIKDYKKYCVGRENPIGVGDTIGSGEEGDACIQDDSRNPMTKYYSTYFTDIRVQDGMDNGVQPGGGQSQNSTSSYAGSAKNKDCKAGDLCWPIEGANSGMITSGRWFQGSHNGYDFGAGGVTFGTPVYNVADGEVIAVGNKSIPNTSPSNFGYGPNVLEGYPAYCDGNGNFNTAVLGGGGGEHIVFIKHTINGKVFYSSYMHMQKNSDLTPGQKISAGQQVGEVGNYGCSSGAHLHFSIQNSITGDYVDPKTYLGELK